jgi:hypothetical protein
MTCFKFIARRRRHGSSAVGRRAAAIAGLALAIGPTQGLANAEVRGTSEAVTIDAKNASIEDVFTALERALGVRFRSSTSLQRQLTGRYEGPLPRVLTRILAGYSYVVKTSEGRTEVTVLGPQSAPARVASEVARAATNAEPAPPSSPALSSRSANTVERPAAAAPSRPGKAADDRPEPSAVPAPIPPEMRLVAASTADVELPAPAEPGSAAPAPELLPESNVEPPVPNADPSGAPVPQAISEPLPALPIREASEGAGDPQPSPPQQ